jgi:predicted NAD-dependent protein-ADP-ribosyltransferase YbiA (DUF1768 family)
MNIGSGNSYPANALSNFSPHPFVLDGVQIISMEGFLQALKFDKPHIQEAVCQLVGRAAKSRGRARNHHWQSRQRLWWKGKEYARDGVPYQQLLTRAYDAMFEQSDSFRRALRATGKATLTHSIGHNDSSKTVLTEREFMLQLHGLRYQHFESKKGLSK